MDASDLTNSAGGLKCELVINLILCLDSASTVKGVSAVTETGYEP